MFYEFLASRIDNIFIIKLMQFIVILKPVQLSLGPSGWISVEMSISLTLRFIKWVRMLKWHTQWIAGKLSDLYSSTHSSHNVSYDAHSREWIRHTDKKAVKTQLHALTLGTRTTTYPESRQHQNNTAWAYTEIQSLCVLRDCSLKVNEKQSLKKMPKNTIFSCKWQRQRRPAAVWILILQRSNGGSSRTSLFNQQFVSPTTV